MKSTIKLEIEYTNGSKEVIDLSSELKWLNIAIIEGVLEIYVKEYRPNGGRNMNGVRCIPLNNIKELLFTPIEEGTELSEYFLKNNSTQFVDVLFKEHIYYSFYNRKLNFFIGNKKGGNYLESNKLENKELFFNLYVEYKKSLIKSKDMYFNDSKYKTLPHKLINSRKKDIIEITMSEYEEDYNLYTIFDILKDGKILAFVEPQEETKAETKEETETETKTKEFNIDPKGLL